MINLTEPTRERLCQERAVLLRERSDLDEGGSGGRSEDFGDNAERLRRADDLARLDSRIREINRLLVRGIDPGRIAGGLADGSRVTLRFEDGSQETLYVAAISEAVRDEDRDHSLSIDSPLGRALAGASPGDVVRYHTPGGARAAHVMAIEPPD